MYGAIVGDLSGSIYEYNQAKQIGLIEPPKSLISSNSFYSDDSILTIAILDAILNDYDYEYYLKKYGKEFINYKPNIEPYFKTPFSPNYMKWINNSAVGVSNGNGAMMRISPIGYLFNTEKEIIDNCILATKPSHNSKEAIDNSITIALIIFYARNGLNKEEIIKKLNLNLKYEPFKKFNSTCNETINNCLFAVFTSNTFEESVRKVISYGGDTDTNACIVGSMAEAMFGMNIYLIAEANNKIPQSFVKKLALGYKKLKK